MYILTLYRDTIDSAPFRDNYGTIEIRANCWKVYVRNADTNDDPDDDHLDDELYLNLIVPGDYVEIENHSALVNRIIYAGGRNTDIEHIRIIEATTYNNKWWVQNIQSLFSYGNDFIAIWRFIPD
ncbi:MAG: hypothetical protein JXB88_21110 [Spirochaetales bacterium]|nr:hypothetical protein [Spirochaetales bacterium]